MVLHPLPPSFIILFHKSKQTFKKGKLDRNLAAWVSVIGINTIIQHCCKSCLKIWFTWHKKKTYEEVCMCMKTLPTDVQPLQNMTMKFSKLVRFARWAFVAKKEEEEEEKAKQNLKPDKKNNQNKKNEKKPNSFGPAVIVTKCIFCLGAPCKGNSF